MFKTISLSIKKLLYKEQTRVYNKFAAKGAAKVAKFGTTKYWETYDKLLKVV